MLAVQNSTSRHIHARQYTGANGNSPKKIKLQLKYIKHEITYKNYEINMSRIYLMVLPDTYTILLYCTYPINVQINFFIFFDNHTTENRQLILQKFKLFYYFLKYRHNLNFKIIT